MSDEEDEAVDRVLMALFQLRAAIIVQAAAAYHADRPLEETVRTLNDLANRLALGLIR